MMNDGEERLERVESKSSVRERGEEENVGCGGGKREREK